MSAPPAAPSPPPIPAALAAFLRGVERRGAVLAELQAGSAQAGDRALATALDATAAQAPGQPVAAWPALFWRTLLAQPGLRRARTADWPADLPLRTASPGIRAAVLLRLVAELDEAASAGVLGVADGSLRRALAQAMPRLGDGRPDAQAWAALRAGLQQRVRALPAGRLGQVAALRANGTATRPHDGPAAPRLAPRLAAVGLAAGLALAATVWLERRAGEGVERAALAPPGQPASRYSPEAGWVAHPDFALLADPAAEALARDIAFLSWSAARADAALPVADPFALPPTPESPPAAATGPASPGETSDAP